MNFKTLFEQSINIMVSKLLLIGDSKEPSYQDYVQELFDEIKCELLDLDTLIDIEYYENPERHEKLVRFKTHCSEIYEELLNIDFEELEGDDPDICEQCAEISTNIYSLLKKLRNKRPGY